MSAPASPAPPVFPTGLTVRPVRDEDAPALQSLIGGIYAEYPGCVMDLPGVDADLIRPATSAAARGGRWWVVTDGDAVVASVGRGPRDHHGIVTLSRLYVAATHRRQGIAASLVQRVERDAEVLGARAVHLWSDTRFEDAHRRYQALGYRTTGAQRPLHDPSRTLEDEFVRDLIPEDATGSVDPVFGVVTVRRRHSTKVTTDPRAVRIGRLSDGMCGWGRIDADPDHRGRGFVDIEVELDADGRVRTVVTGVLRWSSDGQRRWWLGGDELTADARGQTGLAARAAAETAANRVGVPGLASVLEEVANRVTT